MCSLCWPLADCALTMRCAAVAPPPSVKNLTYPHIEDPPPLLPNGCRMLAEDGICLLKYLFCLLLWVTLCHNKSDINGKIDMVDKSGLILFLFY